MADERARRLRKNLTDAETKLWWRLRRRALDGHRFRRQHPIGPYVLDFVCLEQRLVVEVDGGQHGEDDVSARDAARTAWLEGRGYRVLRFWNNDVLRDIDGVLAGILGELSRDVPR